MKRKIALLLAFCLMLVSIPMTAFANDDVTVKLNGRKINFDQPPIIKNNRTLVPMRAIFEAMGCEVEWYEEEQMVDVYLDDENIMTLWIGEYEMWTVNNDMIELDVPPQVLNWRTLVPVRAISESIGATVEWSEYSQTVTITYTESDKVAIKNSINSTTVTVSNPTPTKKPSQTTVFDTEDDDCKHTDIEEVTMIDLRDFYDADLETKHLVTDVVEMYCKTCGEYIGKKSKEYYSSHDFDSSGVCKVCHYKKADGCEHENTSEAFEIDLTKYIDTGSNEQHKVIDKISTYCDDCNEKLRTDEKVSYSDHKYESNTCKLCGHKKTTSSSSSNTSSSNTSSSSSSSSSSKPNGTSEYLNNISFISEYSDSGYAVFSKYIGTVYLNIYVGSKENPDLEVGDETTVSLEYDVSEFSSFTCTANISSSSKLDKNDVKLKIYGDGELIYQSLKMQSNNSVKIDLDISDYDTLEFEVTATVDEKYNKNGRFRLGDAKLWY